MRKKKNTKSRAADLLIILLCFAGTGVSGFAFWREYNRTLVKLNEEPVGSIVFKNRTAHRKIENRVAWDRLKQESPVYNGDTIRTAEESEAFITFEDQITKVNLYENTLVQIFYDSRGTRIDIVGGNVDINSGGRRVFISSGVSTIELESGSQASLNSGGESFSLSMLTGQAKFNNGTELESGGMFSLLNDGTVDTSPAIAVTSFGRFASILGPAEGAASAVFTWNAVNFDADTYVILEVSEDRKFSRIVQARDIHGASSVSVPLETGEYWWRAYPVQGDSREVPGRGYASGRIEALPFTAVSAIAPFPLQEFAFPGETSIPFSWTTVEGAGVYLFEISGNQNMNDPVVSRRVQGTSVVQSGLEPGRWYWRVTPVLSEQVKGTVLPSETGVFSIVRNGAAPAAPSLNAPARNGVIGMDNPLLSWKYDPGAAFWTVEVADNSQMSNPLLRQDSASNFYSLPAGILREDKTYFWRVIAHDARGAGSPSPVRSFTAENVYRQKAVFPPDNYSVTAEEFERMRFTYRSNMRFQNYFQVSSRSDFSSPAINDPVEAGSFYPGSKLEPGIWYWRIYAEGRNGPVSSAPRRLNVVAVSEAPRIFGPSSLSRGTALELNWDSLYFASYQVDLYSARDPRNPVERRITENSYAAFSTGALEPGDYIVRVAGFYPESVRSARIAGVSAEARVTVIPAAPPEPVWYEPVLTAAVISAPAEPEPAAAVVFTPAEPEPAAAVISVPAEPEPAAAIIPVPAEVSAQPARTFNLTRPIPGGFPPEGYVLTTGQLADVPSINFTWEGNAPEYRFALYRANGDIVVPLSVVNSPSFTMQNPRILEPGDYVWEIVERDRRGRPGESMAARFTVREGPMILRTLPTNNPGVLYGNR
ncbi:MAG: FecR domain-containing protein [Treponema sp.]|jgi:hypothetical protein|nr:FecR domain-containing protein [Treponema sp.]